MLQLCWGKVLAFSKPVLPVMFTPFPQCSSHFPISLGSGRGANLAVSLHSFALCHLYAKSTIKMPYSHSLVLQGCSCLYLPVSAGCCEACGGDGAKATGQVPDRAGSGDMAPTTLVPSSKEELMLPRGFAGWEEQHSISQIACSQTGKYFHVPAAVPEE